MKVSFHVLLLSFYMLKDLCDVLEALQLFVGHEIMVHVTLSKRRFNRPS